MKIDSFKDLEKLIKLCQKTGVDAIKIDGIEMSIRPYVKPTVKRSIRPTETFAVGGIDENTKIIPNTIPDPIETDELTDDQLLFYSATGEVQQ